MQTTIERASATETKLRGYYVGKIDGVTVCCSKGRSNTQHNLDFLINNMPAPMLAALIDQGRKRAHGLPHHPLFPPAAHT